MDSITSGRKVCLNIMRPVYERDKKRTEVTCLFLYLNVSDNVNFIV